MENGAPVVGPDVPTANSNMVKPDIATAGLESANVRFARNRGRHHSILGHSRVLMSFSEAAGMTSRNPGFDSGAAGRDTSNSVRQGTTGPRQGNNPTCFDSDSVL